MPLDWDALFKQALAIYTPGMSTYRLQAALGISHHSARILMYKLQQHLANSENKKEEA